jgi:hypothetical protein
MCSGNIWQVHSSLNNMMNTAIIYDIACLWFLLFSFLFSLPGQIMRYSRSLLQITCADKELPYHKPYWTQYLTDCIQPADKMVVV